MIKMGKTQSNKNISPKAYIMIFIFFVILFLCCLFLSIRHYIQIKDYTKTTAKIVNIYETSSGIDMGDRVGQNDNYVEYEYEIDGVIYRKEQHILFKMGKHVGDTTKIKVDRNNPQNIEDTYTKETSFIALLVMSLVLLLMIPGMKENMEFERKRKEHLKEIHKN